MNNFKAAIFDLDGTIIDNNAIHYESWVIYLEQLNMKLTYDDYKINISGRTNHDVIEYILGRKMTSEEAASYYLEKEKIYRALYAPLIKPVDGLIPLLEELKSKEIKMAIATSGLQVNIDFMFQHIPIQHYFEKVVNSTHITKGKPDPEIFITTAAMLNIEQEHCIVFEDSIAGVNAALAAKMRVVALTTTHSKQELNFADKVIDDFTEVNYSIINGLFR